MLFKFNGFCFALSIVLLNSKKMVSDVVSEKNSYAFEAEKFGQYFFAFHYVISVASLGAYYTGSFNSLDYLFLNLFLGHAGDYLL
jgi:hypothetical protein